MNWIGIGFIDEPSGCTSGNLVNRGEIPAARPRLLAVDQAAIACFLSIRCEEWSPTLREGHKLQVKIMVFYAVTP
jgi:hypothetical protein